MKVRALHGAPVTFGDPLGWRCDDNDADARTLWIHQGGNGDWYVSVGEATERFPAHGVRLATSGGIGFEIPEVVGAIAEAYRSMFNHVMRWGVA